MMDDFGTTSNGGGPRKYEGDDSTLNDHSDSENGERMYREDRRTPSDNEFGGHINMNNHRNGPHHSPNSDSAGSEEIERTGDEQMRFERAQRNFMMDLMNKSVKMVQVTYPRTANNEKELTVSRGEYLEVLDDTRKWWKTRNLDGQVGHVPHTIVTPVINDHSPGMSPHNNSAEWIQKERRGKKGEFRYF